MFTTQRKLIKNVLQRGAGHYCKLKKGKDNGNDRLSVNEMLCVELYYRTAIQYLSFPRIIYVEIFRICEISRVSTFWWIC